MSGIGFHLILPYFCTAYTSTVTSQHRSKYSDEEQSGRAAPHSSGTRSRRAAAPPPCLGAGGGRGLRAGSQALLGERWWGWGCVTARVTAQKAAHGGRLQEKHRASWIQRYTDVAIDKPHAIPSSFCISFFSGLNVPRKNKLSISLHELKPLHYTVQYRKCKMSPHQIGYTSDMVKYGSCFACKTQSESRPSRTAVQPPRSRRPGAPSPSAPFVEILTGKTKKKVLRGKGKKNRLRLRKFSIYALPQVWCQFLSAADAEAPAQGLRCTWLCQQGLPSSFCFPSRAGCSPAPRSSPAPLGTQLLCRATHTHRAWKK